MSAPAPATVPQGLWRDLETAPGELVAEDRVCVLIDGDPTAADATKAALARQTYPAELLDVVEAGADADPTGEIVVLVAAGVVPGPDLVAAHARWHHAAADVVSFGPLGAGPDEPVSMIVDLTRDFTDLDGGYHLAAAEGTMAMRRGLYDEAGGASAAPPEVQRLDLAHRLHCAGAVFVHEQGASAEGRAPGLSRAVAGACETGATLEYSFPLATGFVALPPWRGVTPARRHERPAMVVNLDPADAATEDVVATIAGALGGEIGDIELRVQVPESDPRCAAIESAFGGDARASISGSSLDEGCRSPFQVALPPVAKLDPRTIGDLHELALGEGVGALHVTVPGVAPQDAMIEVVATRAWQRARRLAAVSGDSPEAIIGDLFGERWVSGVEVSTRRHGVEEPQVTEHGPLSAATDRDHERSAYLRFRERANDLAERAATLHQRTLVERLQARRERQAAERIEARHRG